MHDLLDESPDGRGKHGHEPRGAGTCETVGFMRGSSNSDTGVSSLIGRATRVRELLSKFTRHPGFRHAPVRAAVRLVDWRVRCWLGRPGVIIWPDHEPLRMVLPPIWVSSYIDTYVFRGADRPDRELTWLARRLAPGHVFIDIGANIGQWTMPIAQIVGPTGHVVAIEPASATAAALTKGLAVNGLTMATVISVALSDSDGTAHLHHHARDPSQHSFAAVGIGSEEVRTRTLDAVLADHPVERVDAMKLDVEGAEEIVLRGASRTLDAHRPIVIFEVCKGLPERLGLDPDGAWRLLDDAGYRCFRILDGGDVRPAAVKELAGQTGGWNVIAVPGERADGLARPPVQAEARHPAPVGGS